MSGIILSAVELNSHLNGNRDKNDQEHEHEHEHTICETAIEIDETQNYNNNNNIKILTNNNGLTQPNTIIDEDHHTIVDSVNNLDCDTTRKRSPTANSIGSNNISIVTLDDDESSVVDSDSDIEDVINCNDRNNRSENGIVLMDKHLDPPNMCQSSILCTQNDSKPVIGSIAVNHSSDITFGNKTFYQGPVTIKQFVYDKNKWKENDPPENDNTGYVNSSTDKLSRMQNDLTDTKEHPDGLEKKWQCTNKQALFSAILTGVLVCSLLALILFAKYTSAVNDRNSSSSDIITDTAGPLRIISRSEWIAQPPEHDLVPLELPSTRVIIAHTATENCTTQASCTYQVRLIQTFHIESRGWDDIAYNFLVGGDGAVYVGRGWDTQGAHTKGYNVKSICIAFIGTFNKIVPPKRQLIAAQKMIEEGVKLKKLTEDYALYGHRQLIASESPGLALYEVMKKWDHWTDHQVIS